MICPLMSNQAGVSASDDQTALVSMHEDCMKERCAWWIEKSEEYKMGGKCAVVMLVAND